MTPDQLQQIIDRMGAEPWKRTDGDIRNGDDHLVHGREQHYPTAMDDEDADGVIVLRNHASALIEVARAAQVYRNGILQRECDEREWCAAGQTVSAEQLREMAERIDAALKRLEEIK
jgi:hypothetical protein